MKLRVLAGLIIFAGLHAAPATTTKQHLLVDFPSSRMPKHLWARELVWLKNIGIHAIVASGATPELKALALEASIEIEEPDAKCVRVSALDPNALLKSRMAIHDRQQVEWTDVESEVLPVFKRGAVSLEGAEDPSLQVLRREALMWEYWPNVLVSEGAEDRQVSGL